ncbi:MAG: peptidoglycan bridge formation glycyltransferase FemA/FemB family protein [bacterium]
MEVLAIKDNQPLNNFAAGLSGGQFLQSGHWADFQQSLNRPVWRFLAKENNEIIGSALVIKQPLPLGRHYLYCPRGPLVLKEENQALIILLDKIKELAKKEGSIFLRIEPLVGSAGFLKNNNFVKTAPVQPQNTLRLSLDQPAEKILAGFHQKTRYNIRLAEKKGIKIRISTSENDLDAFWQLIKQTSVRDKFNSHPREYYSALVRGLGGQGLLKIFIAEHGGKVLAVNLNIFFGDTAIYLHGASSDESRNLMAPYLLQWAAIQEAKKLGFRYYDFWGVAPEKAVNHPWAGVTRFKLGFGGQRLDYLGAWDLPIKKFWYKLYIAIKKFR